MRPLEERIWQLDSFEFSNCLLGHELQSHAGSLKKRQQYRWKNWPFHLVACLRFTINADIPHVFCIFNMLHRPENDGTINILHCIERSEQAFHLECLVRKEPQLQFWAFLRRHTVTSLPHLLAQPVSQWLFWHTLSEIRSWSLLSWIITVLVFHDQDHRWHQLFSRTFGAGERSGGEWGSKLGRGHCCGKNAGGHRGWLADTRGVAGACSFAFTSSTCFPLSLSFGCDVYCCFSKPFLPFPLGVAFAVVSPGLVAEPPVAWVARALLSWTLRPGLWPARWRLLRGGETGVGVGKAGRSLTWSVWHWVEERCWAPRRPSRWNPVCSGSVLGWARRCASGESAALFSASISSSSTE